MSPSPAGCGPDARPSSSRRCATFSKLSFTHGGVLGATLIVPPPGSDSREFGILRTFADEKERDDFYASPLFKAWEKQCEPLTEPDSGTRRPLHGLEAWFRSPHSPPPKWKMAAATFLGVFPTAMLLNVTLGPLIRAWPFVLSNAVVQCLHGRAARPGSLCRA